MRKRYFISEILAVGLLVAFVVGLPVLLFRYHRQQWQDHPGRIVGIVARNDNITGKPGQWIVQKDSVWDFQDMEQPSELEINQGTEVTLRLTSVDAVHEFSLDGYQLKQKIYPGEVVEITFVANTLGEFSFECLNFCGEGHEDMVGKIVVVPQDDQSVAHN